MRPFVIGIILAWFGTSATGAQTTSDKGNDIIGDHWQHTGPQKAHSTCSLRVIPRQTASDSFGYPSKVTNLCPKAQAASFEVKAEHNRFSYFVTLLPTTDLALLTKIFGANTLPVSDLSPNQNLLSDISSHGKIFRLFSARITKTQVRSNAPIVAPLRKAAP